MSQRTSTVRTRFATSAVLAALVSLAACSEQTPPALPSATAPAAPAASVQAPVTATTPSAIDAPAPAAPVTSPATDAATSADASWREARQAAIEVQQRLRAEQQARKDALRDDAKNERCIEGRRIRRVENGWVEAGSC